MAEKPRRRRTRSKAPWVVAPAGDTAPAYFITAVDNVLQSIAPFASSIWWGLPGPDRHGQSPRGPREGNVARDHSGCEGSSPWIVARWLNFTGCPSAARRLT